MTTTTKTPLDRALAYMRLFAEDPGGRSAHLRVAASRISIEIHLCARSLVPPHAKWSTAEREGDGTFEFATWKDGGIAWTAYPNDAPDGGTA